MLRSKLASILIPIAVAGGVVAIAPAAQADTGASDNNVSAASVRATEDEAPQGADGSIVFRSERYKLSDRAVVSMSPTTIRIVDDSATSTVGKRTSLYIQFGYALDPNNPTMLRVTSGIAIRGYNFADGSYDRNQAIQIGQSVLSIDSRDWSEATHAWGHLNSPHERGIDLDVHGLHFGSPS
jgi:hypothetical protein